MRWIMIKHQISKKCILDLVLEYKNILYVSSLKQKLIILLILLLSVDLITFLFTVLNIYLYICNIGCI